jgi:3-dehydroquinate synthetase
VAETRLAEQIGLAEAGLTETISGVLRGLGLPVEIPPGLKQDSILQAIGADKKRMGGKVRFALPVKIGEVKEGMVIDGLSDHLFYGR